MHEHLICEGEEVILSLDKAMTKITVTNLRVIAETANTVSIYPISKVTKVYTSKSMLGYDSGFIVGSEKVAFGCTKDNVNEFINAFTLALQKAKAG